VTTKPVYMTRFGTTWHTTPECRALDDARLTEGGHVLQEPAKKSADRRPCLVCATAPATPEA
jgi:hypothetical protein